MKSISHLLIIFLVATLVFFSCNQQTDQKARLDSLVSHFDARRVMLPNGWSLSPAGKSLPMGDFPMNLVVSPSGKFMAVTNNGHGRQTIALIDPSTEKILDETEIRKSWYGLTFSKDETRLYASGGNDNMIVVYH